MPSSRRCTRCKLVADGGAFVPELVDTVAADDVAPAEAP